MTFLAWLKQVTLQQIFHSRGGSESSIDFFEIINYYKFHLHCNVQVCRSLRLSQVTVTSHSVSICKHNYSLSAWWGRKKKNNIANEIIRKPDVTVQNFIPFKDKQL